VRDPSGAADWVRALENRPAEKPFFMWFAAVDPHRPYQENIIDQPHQPYDVDVPPFLPDNEFTRKDLALYYVHVGKVLDELDRQDIAENTMVIFMTDNGRPFPRCKTRMLDDGLKSPFIVRWPALIQAGSTSNSLISSVDLAPTICELAVAEALPQFQGVSFVPVLKDAGATVRDFVVGEHNWHDYQAQGTSTSGMPFLSSTPTLRLMLPEALLTGKWSDCIVKVHSLNHSWIASYLPVKKKSCMISPWILCS